MSAKSKLPDQGEGSRTGQACLGEVLPHPLGLASWIVQGSSHLDSVIGVDLACMCPILGKIIQGAEPVHAYRQSGLFRASVALESSFMDYNTIS